MEDDTEDRVAERQRALREGFLGELTLALAHPPCSRHDDTADDRSDRVRLAYAYALGLLRDAPRAVRLSALILRLHDHKGELFVVCARPLPGDLRRALRRAWREVGDECEENVSFEAPGAERWRWVWKARRFGRKRDAALPVPARANPD